MLNILLRVRPLPHRLPLPRSPLHDRCPNPLPHEVVRGLPGREPRSAPVRHADGRGYYREEGYEVFAWVIRCHVRVSLVADEEGDEVRDGRAGSELKTRGCEDRKAKDTVPGEE